MQWLNALVIYAQIRKRRINNPTSSFGNLFQAKNSQERKLHLSWIDFQKPAWTVWEDDPDVSKRTSLSLVRCNSVALNSQVRT